VSFGEMEKRLVQNLSSSKRCDSLNMKYPGFDEILEGFLWGERSFSIFEFQEKP
jgi:hypothetical protein